ncbi:uncharacterized protein BJ171DRAFT_600488 [Polychytrium aggregatum]|uniref:uncharacterized protein n=1 Tax=Polychytrium aggregatum TaxID=110093 RepID=UPI0022FDEC12|nr:uncharacterized protein BJ171DRAFT_600488 [Polychytrium aggregatum]KAI9203050.1 hypothetical protein BJ171DRAFT_600488 [Polychytrium aggregatum]
MDNVAAAEQLLSPLELLAPLPLPSFVMFTVLATAPVTLAHVLLPSALWLYLAMVGTTAVFLRKYSRKSVSRVGWWLFVSIVFIAAFWAQPNLKVKLYSRQTPGQFRVSPRIPTNCQAPVLRIETHPDVNITALLNLPSTAFADDALPTPALSSSLDDDAQSIDPHEVPISLSAIPATGSRASPPEPMHKFILTKGERIQRHFLHEFEFLPLNSSLERIDIRFSLECKRIPVNIKTPWFSVRNEGQALGIQRSRTTGNVYAPLTISSLKRRVQKLGMLVHLALFWPLCTFTISVGLVSLKKKYGTTPMQALPLMLTIWNPSQESLEHQKHLESMELAAEEEERLYKRLEFQQWKLNQQAWQNRQLERRLLDLEKELDELQAHSKTGYEEDNEAEDSERHRPLSGVGVSAAAKKQRRISSRPTSISTDFSAAGVGSTAYSIIPGLDRLSIQWPRGYPSFLKMPRRWGGSRRRAKSPIQTEIEIDEFYRRHVGPSSEDQPPVDRSESRASIFSDQDGPLRREFSFDEGDDARGRLRFRGER